MHHQLSAVKKVRGHYGVYWQRILITGLLSLLLACAAKQTAPLPQEEQLRVSAVAVSQNGFSVKVGETVAWRSELLWIGRDASSSDPEALTRLDIQQEIQNQLSQQGLKFVSELHADYTLVAAVVIGDSKEGAALAELARLHPSLSQVSQTLEKGTLMVGLSRPGSPVVLWRSAVQVFLAEDISHEQRRARVQSVVRSLLGTLPKEF